MNNWKNARRFYFGGKIQNLTAWRTAWRTASREDGGGGPLLSHDSNSLPAAETKEAIKAQPSTHRTLPLSSSPTARFVIFHRYKTGKIEFDSARVTHILSFSVLLLLFLFPLFFFSYFVSV